MPFAWGRYYTDEELQQIADAMNKVGKTMEEINRYANDAEERRKKNPRGLAF